MAKQKRVNKKDFILGFIIGSLIAIILSSLLNAVIFKKIIRENRAQSEQIQLMLNYN